MMLPAPRYWSDLTEEEKRVLTRYRKMDPTEQKLFRAAVKGLVDENRCSADVVAAFEAALSAYRATQAGDTAVVGGVS